jgi:hypothetical protein
MQKYETGENSISVGAALALCRIYGITPNEMLGYAETTVSFTAPISAQALKLAMKLEQLSGTARSAVAVLADEMIASDRSDNVRAQIRRT